MQGRGYGFFVRKSLSWAHYKKIRGSQEKKDLGGKKKARFSGKRKILIFGLPGKPINPRISKHTPGGGKLGKIKKIVKEPGA